MRIAFIAPYQGLTLTAQRPIIRNLSLGARVKIELISTLFQASSHTIEILSQGEVIERSFRRYPALVESEGFNPGIPVFYSSALPVRFLNGLWSTLSILHLFKKRHRACPYDLVLIYNLKPPQVACAKYAIRRLGLPVVLEYEDDRFLNAGEEGGSRFSSNIQVKRARTLLRDLAGCMAGSSGLLSQVPIPIPRLLLPGVVSPSIAALGVASRRPRRNWVVFAGTHHSFQGLEQLVKAWRMLKQRDWELHIAGAGGETKTLHKLAEGDPTIVFHGVLNERDNAEFLAAGRLSVVAYDVSRTRGFSFKTIECLAAGLHVITTRLSALEALAPELKQALTYLEDSAPETIATTIQTTIAERRHERTAPNVAIERYGPVATARQLDDFIKEVMLFREGTAAWH